MSRERELAVLVPLDAELGALLRDVVAAHRRAEKSEPGERTDIAAYEALSSALELKAVGALIDGAGTRVTAPDEVARTAGLFARADGGVIVAVTLPLENGSTARDGALRAAPKPADPVEIRADIKGRQLVLERFRSQLDAAIAEPGKDRVSALSPSGVHNRVLTEALREYVDRRGKQPVSVPVVYRDGSRAMADFPFHCVGLASTLVTDDEARASGMVVLRLALLSTRHPEMDAVVDGAWLRNADVSKPRPAAQTDDYVYHASVKQLDELTAGGRQRVRVYMFQTGLETAVVGFFRAVVEFLSRHPGQLEVIPMFYVKNPRSGADAGGEFAGYEQGDAWATSEGAR